MKSTIEVGKRGELIAAEYLKDLGYKLLCSNFRARRCEIDLVALKEGCLVFVEVKTLSRCNNKVVPSNGQIRRLIYAAKSFIKTQRFSASSFRFDLIRISTNKNSVKVEHLKDCIDPTSFLI